MLICRGLVVVGRDCCLITSGFAGTVESIGIVIIFGIMLGNYLDSAKATNKMALDTVKLVGQKRSGIAMDICWLYNLNPGLL